MATVSVRRTYGILIVVAIGAVGVLIALAAVGAVRQSVVLSLNSGVLKPAFLLMLVPFAAWSFGLRVMRWHTLARTLVPGLSLKVSGYTQIVGFAFSATPGRIAELYKLKLLERSTNVPMAQSLPAALVERLTDLAAFGLLVVIGGFGVMAASPLRWPGIGGETATRWIVILLGLVVVALSYGAARQLGAWDRLGRSAVGAWQRSEGRWSRFLPGTARLAALVSQVRTGGTKVTNPYTLSLALAFVVIGRLGDGVVLWQIAHAVGYPVPFSLALLMIGSAGFVGGITLSPGGLGAAEATLVGLIAAHGAPLGAALVTAFGARAMIFWLWVLVGLIVFAISHSKYLVGGTGLRARRGALAKD
ncbi:MAG TPA: lysylphosphatidylglycerol synthase transmembrane domain-containing protein [Chloroflexota bacterium]|nr:lysylphosphatidylglycerol synthase transmembrane domain-containing protein [Chloroflexota bacterium]